MLPSGEGTINSMIFDFMQDVRNEVLKWLPHDRSDPNVVATINNLSDHELLVRFFNWLQRLVHPHPRTVFKSQEFSSQFFNDEQNIDLAKIIQKIEGGDEITPHLSKRILSGFVLDNHSVPLNTLNRRHDLDLLLNDWGIHHLHISNQIERDGFVKRTGPLLFSIFTQGKAFLLEVFPEHGDWTDQRLVEIAVRNWPLEGLFIQLNGALGLSTPISTSDRSQLRSAGIDIPIEVDGKVYVSKTMGLSSAGTSAESTLKADRLLYSLESIQRNFQENPYFLRPEFERIGKEYPSAPVFRLVFARNEWGFGFALQEVASKVTFPVSS